MGKSLVLLAVLLVLGAMGLAACGPSAGGPESKTVYVGPYLVDCVGVAPQQCMLVKEDPQGEWTMHYDQIAGFDYKEGFGYELLISEETIDNPPADASSIRWTLIEVVSMERSLEGTDWLLESYRDSSGSLAGVLPENQVTARFREGQVGGNAGCNSYFGGYELDGNRLTVGSVGMTEMYCFPEELMAQEGQYLAALQSAAAFKIDGDRLEITQAGGEPVLVYSVLPVPEPASLIGSPWLLTAISTGQDGIASVLAGTEVTAMFADGGNMSGSAGCNNYQASYQLEGDRITIGPAAATMMMCPGPEGIMEQESAYLSALESVANYHIVGANLELADVEGKTLLTYTLLEPLPLVGTRWQMMFYNNGKGGLASALAGTEITAVFSGDGNVSGSAGCNNYSAGYRVEGETIEVGPAATTRMMCAEPEGIMDQESGYLAALGSAATYRIEGDNLQLLDAGGTRLVEYAAVDNPGLSDEGLKNMAYKSDWTREGLAPLSNGEYREQSAPGSATETIVLLSPYIAHGELNGEPAAAVIMITDPGGSGTFYDLAVVMEREGQFSHVATAALGDRAQINSLAIESGQIVVDMVIHGPEDPMCCPTQHVLQAYALQGEELVQVSSEVVEGDS